MRKNGMRQLVLMAAVILLLGLLPAISQAESCAAFGGKAYPQTAEYIDLEETVVTDFDQFEAFLGQMPNLKRVDMWETHMAAENCDRLAKAFPQIKWGWTMVLKGKDHEHLIRTDYTSWSTLHNNKSSHHRSEDFSILKYCWNLMALDIGHNSVTDLSFLNDLPNLRVLIIACNEVTDITPMANLKHLEYAEIFKNKITDISPLTGMEHMLDLNLCFNYIRDFTPVKGMKSLMRLWTYSSTNYNQNLPENIAAELKEALPDTWIDTKHYSTTGGWRTDSGGKNHPHYQAIIDMFGGDHLHPKYEYVPFAESAPQEQTEEETPALATPVPMTEVTEGSGEQEAGEQAAAPAAEAAPPKDFLLPIDFMPGSEPKAENFTETTYEDSTIKVSITTDTFDSSRYWVADIQLTDVSQLRTMAASANGTFERSGQLTVATFAARCKAVVAINGDYFDSSERAGLGYIVRQGVLFRNNLDQAGFMMSRLMDVLVIDENGDFHIIYQADRERIDDEIQKLGHRVINSFSFGPALVDGGKLIEDYRGADRWLNMAADERRQRICLCQAGPLHYKVICCAGNYQKSTGLTLKEFSELVAGQDVQVAYNLDGGDSTWLCFNGIKVNEFGSSSQRKLMDIIYFASAE